MKLRYARVGKDNIYILGNPIQGYYISYQQEKSKRTRTLQTAVRGAIYLHRFLTADRAKRKLTLRSITIPRYPTFRYKGFRFVSVYY